MKIRWFIFIAAVAAAVWVFGSINAPTNAAVSGDGEVDIRFTPPDTTVNVGENFTVEVIVDGGTQTINGVTASINFDTAFLELVSYVLTAPLTEIPAEPTPGNITISAGTTGTPLASPGTFVFARITFLAKAPTPSTPLTFISVRGRRTSVTSPGGIPNLRNAIDGTVTIE